MHMLRLAPPTRHKSNMENFYILQQTIDSLTQDQIQSINDGLRHYQESLMSSKDRRALLEYWLTVAQRNESFRDWFISQLVSLDEPKAVVAFQTALGMHQLTTVDVSSQSSFCNGTKYCIAMILCISIAFAMLLIAAVFYSPGLKNTNTAKNKTPTRIVVAENDTVIAGTYPSSSTMSLNVNEIVLKGDGNHDCYMLVVPNNILKYHWNTLNDEYNGTTIVDKLPVVNYMYVYLLSGSTVEMELCLGNVSNSPPAVLYGFDNETQYIEYNEYLTASNPALHVPLTVGSIGHIMCSNITFKAQTSNYYFFILLAPLKDTVYSVKTIVNSKYINYKEYVVDYSYCVVANGHNCSLSLSVNHEEIKSDVSVLVYTQLKYDLSSKINHLDLTIQALSGLTDNKNNCIIFWSIIGMSCFLILLVFSVVLYLWCLYWRKEKAFMRNKGCKYTRIPVNGIN